MPAGNVEAFFDAARNMNFYDDQATTAGQLFERFFPGREDVVRLLMEPITYANGSTLEDPALTYGIVFSNFMSKGVYTFRGGTEQLIRLMERDLTRNGVDVRTRCPVEKIHVAETVPGTVSRRVEAVTIAGRRIGTRAVISNANLLGTIFNLVGPEHWDADFLEQARAVRLNNSSTQVYMALKPETPIEESQCGDLLFSSTAPKFRTDLLLSRNVTSRTFSFYYPQSRPGLDRCVDRRQHERQLRRLGRAVERGLRRRQAGTDRKHAPGDGEVRARRPRPARARRGRHAVDVRALHPAPRGASFGTKFEGLAVSRALPEQIAGLYHAGSVGIIMSGWLGAVNYGVIVANDVDAWLMKDKG